LVTEVLGHNVSFIVKGHTVQEECHYSWGLLSSSTPSFCWVVFGGGRDESVNAAMGIIDIYWKNKMKHSVPELLHISAGGI
jgi:hypothetical protein